jgi:hypothetical protein
MKKEFTFLFLVSCGSLGGYANIKPALENTEIPIEEEVTDSVKVLDSDDFWDTSVKTYPDTGDTGVFFKPYQDTAFKPYRDTF